jgi:2,5-diketo-D-gluconate reductase B
MLLKTVSGDSIFPIGIGTWGIVGTWEVNKKNQVAGVAGVRYSISKGQNHIDTGQIYGGGYTDEFLGHALEGTDRKSLYIGDKIWETNVAKGLVRPAVKEMLRKLKTDYIDLLYIHKPWEEFPWREAVPQINELIDEGIVRQFAASNFTVTHLKEATKLSKHPIAANQLHHNILFRGDATDEMVTYCKANNIQIIAYRPLEQGKVLENPVVIKIAEAHSATPVQVALAWLIHQNMLPIPMAIEKKFIDQNIAAVDLKLSPKETAELNKLG